MSCDYGGTMREMEGERERERQTYRQTDSQTERQGFEQMIYLNCES